MQVCSTRAKISCRQIVISFLKSYTFHSSYNYQIRSCIYVLIINKFRIEQIVSVIGLLPVRCDWAALLKKPIEGPGRSQRSSVLSGCVCECLNGSSDEHSSIMWCIVYVLMFKMVIGDTCHIVLQLASSWGNRWCGLFVCVWKVCTRCLVGSASFVLWFFCLLAYVGGGLCWCSGWWVCWPAVCMRGLCCLEWLQRVMLECVSSILLCFWVLGKLYCCCLYDWDC